MALQIFSLSICPLCTCANQADQDKFSRNMRTATGSDMAHSFRRAGPLNGIAHRRRLYKGKGEAGENLAAEKMGNTHEMRMIDEGIAAGSSKEVAA
jgi:hypothetical protein